ncbi:hypothetical protein BLOT_004048 [Blomia tropicalis]|nr:hypothetical protein BLOT_004048 [Blomia tropicalis]
MHPEYSPPTSLYSCIEPIVYYIPELRIFPMPWFFVNWIYKLHKTRKNDIHNWPNELLEDACPDVVDRWSKMMNNLKHAIVTAVNIYLHEHCLHSPINKNRNLSDMTIHSPDLNVM